jgi:hypothetical protein
MRIIKYIVLFVKYFFMFFGAWSIFYLLNYIPCEYSYKVITSSSFYAFIMALVALIISVFKK